MKRIKLCWSIARIINAHTDADTDRQRGKKQIRLHVHIQIHIQNWLSRHSRASVVGAVAEWGKLPNVGKTKDSSRQWPLTAQLAWIPISVPLTLNPLHPLPLPPSPSTLLLLLLLKAIKRWFPAFCLQFSAISLQTHTHTHTDKSTCTVFAL